MDGRGRGVAVWVGVGALVEARVCVGLGVPVADASEVALGVAVAPGCEESRWMTIGSHMFGFGLGAWSSPAAGPGLLLGRAIGEPSPSCAQPVAHAADSKAHASRILAGRAKPILESAPTSVMASEGRMARRLLVT